MKSGRPAVLSVLCLFLLARPASGLTITSNGYNDLLVAIGSDVPENLQLIDDIKTIITSASAFLYTASRQRAYFRSVTILAPSSWSAQSGWSARQDESLSRAEVRVDSANPLYGEAPYTFQPGQCGEPGRYVHLTADFVTNATLRQLHYGDAGKLFVREFARLRYGVFPENGFGTEKYPDFYLDDDNTLRPTGFADAVKGYFLRSQNGGACAFDAASFLPQGECVFCASDTNTTSGSIMATPHVTSELTFREASSSSALYHHDGNSPNQQNYMCNSLGAWDVISQHGDFKNDNSATSISDTTPTYTVVHETASSASCGRRGVLVLDRSGSMQYNLGYYKQAQAAALLIDQVPVGSRLAIVTFSSSASTWQAFRHIQSEADRTYLKSILPSFSDYGGRTAIGLGLQQAISVLQADGTTSSEDHVLLTTDGMENETPYVSDVISSVVASGVTVTTLAYGNSADDSLRNLSSTTEGSYFFATSAVESTAIQALVSSVADSLNACSDNRSYSVDRTVITFSSSGSGNIYVDWSIGDNSVFTFTLPVSSTMEVTLTSPSGTVYNSASSEYSYSSSLNIITISIPQAQEGQWSYVISSSGYSYHSVVGTLQSQARTGTDPIEVDAWMSDLTFDPAASDWAVIYAHAHQGYNPLLEASVVADVLQPSSASALQVALRDDGQKPDSLAGDGVYSAYFTAYSSTGRYAVEVGVSAVAGQTHLLQTASQSSKAVYSDCIYTPSAATTTVAVNEITRTEAAGAFDVSGSVSSSDVTPPANVSDLQVVAINSEAQTISLQWTSPGDDLNTGQASSYDLRCASSYDSLQVNYSQAVVVTSSLLVQGDLSPLTAGSVHSVTVAVSSLDFSPHTYVFGLKATDDAGLTSSLSNCAIATFEVVTYEQNLGTDPTLSQTATAPASSSESETEAGTNTAAIIGATVGGVAAVGAALAGLGVAVAKGAFAKGAAAAGAGAAGGAGNNAIPAALYAVPAEGGFAPITHVLPAPV